MCPESTGKGQEEPQSYEDYRRQAVFVASNNAKQISSFIYNSSLTQNHKEALFVAVMADIQAEYAELLSERK